MRRITFFSTFFLMMAPIAIAQPTNLEVFQTLALRCLDFASESDHDFLLDAPPNMPFVRSAIISSLNQNGQQVYLADSTYLDQPLGLATLSYKIDGTNIDYVRQRKKKAGRTIEYLASTSLISAQGEVLRDKVCVEQFTDTVPIEALHLLESSSYPETKGSPPEAGFFKRVFQPVVLTAATVLTVYLFFTLRSESSNDGT